jgi:hypothetical protein
VQKLSIVAADNMVIIDNFGIAIDCSSLRVEGIHAVQWDEATQKGHVEYVIPGTDASRNEAITDIAKFQDWVDTHGKVLATVPDVAYLKAAKDAARNVSLPVEKKVKS